jgi:hypothetical protein
MSDPELKLIDCRGRTTPATLPRFLGSGDVAKNSISAIKIKIALREGYTGAL